MSWTDSDWRFQHEDPPPSCRECDDAGCPACDPEAGLRRAVEILREKPPLILANDDARDVAGWFQDRAERAIAALSATPTGKEQQHG
jgi:hypothetical protein